jgi:nucleotide-binding universal stress UspA family protein
MDGIFHRILMPVDGSRSSAKAVRFALRLACQQGCEVIALHVVDEEMAGDMARYTGRKKAEILERMQRSGEGIVAEVRRLAQDEGAQVKAVAEVGVPYRVIIARTREEQADLIVMGTVGRKGPRRVLIGSVTERVIEYSPVPVLVVK